MKIRNRLSLFTSLIFSIIFAIISLITYGLYKKNAERNILEDLHKASFITAFFYLEEDELNKEDYAKIIIQFSELVSGLDYQIYNEMDMIRYSNDTIGIEPSILNEIREKRSLAFEDQGNFCFGIFYEDNQGDFVVITKKKQRISYRPGKPVTVDPDCLFPSGYPCYCFLQ